MKSDKQRILLVDDEPDITAVMKLGLQNYGFEVDAFNFTAQALSAFRAGFYDLIFLDVRMPGMSGFEVAREIWKNDTGARVCFMTAFEIYENEASKVFPNFKTHCFIKKPIGVEALVKHVRSHFVKTG